MSDGKSIAVSSNSKHYVYTLAYPNGQVFYVGKGQGKRIDAHEREAKSGCACNKCKTIQQVWACGKQVLKQIVFETSVESEAFEYEAHLINTFDGAVLVNIMGNKSKGYHSVDKVLIRKATFKRRIIGNIAYVSIKEISQAFSLKRRYLSLHLNMSGVVCHQFPFPFDRNWYILKSDVERIKQSIEEYGE